jgi:hypothetical protein
MFTTAAPGTSHRQKTQGKESLAKSDLNPPRAGIASWFQVWATCPCQDDPMRLSLRDGQNQLL